MVDLVPGARYLVPGTPIHEKLETNLHCILIIN